MRRIVGLPLLPLVGACFAAEGLALPAPEDRPCSPLTMGQRVAAVARSDSGTCFRVSLDPGVAAQISVAHPTEDLSIHSKRGDSRMVSDGFEFGRETLTLIPPGDYVVEVRRVLAGKNLPLNVQMSLTRLPLPEAEEWRRAEEAANQSKTAPSRKSASDSLELWTKLWDASAVARTYLKLSNSLWLENSATTLAASEKAFEICRSLPDLRCAAEAAHYSGISARTLGDFDLCRRRLEEASDIWKKLGLTHENAVTLTVLGGYYRQISDYQRAINSYQEAMRYIGNRRHPDYLAALNNLGLCYLLLAEYDRAAPFFREAAVGYDRLDRVGYSARAHLDLGRSYFLSESLRGRIPLARVEFDFALTKSRAASDRMAEAAALNNLGQLFLEVDNPAEARNALQEALKIDRERHDTPSESSVLHNLGRAARAEGNLEEARTLLKSALQMRSAIGLRDDVSDSQFALADLEFSAGDLAAAGDYCEQAMKTLEFVRTQVPGAALRASYFARKRRLFDLLVDIAATPGGTEGAEASLLASERVRARSLMDLLAVGTLIEQVPAKLLSDRAAAQRRIDGFTAQLAGHSGQATAGLQDSIQRAIGEDQELEVAIREIVAKQPLGKAPVSLDQIRREYLPPDTALLEFHLGERTSYLWVVDHGHDQVRWYKLPARSAIEALAADAVHWFGNWLDRQRFPRRQRDFERSMNQLGDTLFGQVAELRLPARLILVPDGVLHQVPLAALRAARNLQPLGLGHDLIQIPAASFLGAGRKPRQVKAFPRSFLALADPVFAPNDKRVPEPFRHRPTGAPGQDLARVSFTDELETVKQLVPEQRWTELRGLASSRASLSGLRLRDYAVVEFSTHTIIDDRIPEVSRIALSMVDEMGHTVDGFLRPYHLAKFRLNGSLVVLSSCDTALGKQVLGEGLAGFTTSLFAAGASQLVLSLSEVDAPASAAFLASVYREYFGGSTGIERAIRVARRKMAATKQWEDPYYWASFVVMGMPSSSR